MVLRGSLYVLCSFSRFLDCLNSVALFCAGGTAGLYLGFAVTINTVYEAQIFPTFPIPVATQAAPVPDTKQHDYHDLPALYATCTVTERVLLLLSVFKAFEINFFAR